MRHSTCPYYEQVQLAVEGRKVLMNFSSFLYQTGFTDRFGQRDLLIIDEGHHCEEQLMDFVTVTINDRDLITAHLELPDLEEATDYALWLLDNNVLDIMTTLVSQARSAGNVRRHEELLHTQWRLRRFLKCIEDGMTDWVHEFKVHQQRNEPSYRSVTIKPVFVPHFANELLWSYGKRVLIMSATILSANVMSRALGIDQNDMAFYRMPNSFPVNNRPIFIIPAVRATGGKGNQHTWGPPMVKWVDGIVRKYRGKRGIIHTHNFSIANMLMSQCRERKRFLFQQSFRDKVEMLEAHASCPDSVLVAPAMHEGLDLKDDLSRFQIIAKTPYPNFFEDRQLAARIENDRRFLIWLVALRLVQAYGRSVRSAEDWAHTYIIDGAVYRFLAEADRMLPDWFKEAIIRVPLNGA
jgi:Rad3-related DNA helicase